MIDPKQIWSSSQLPTLPTVAVRLLEFSKRPDVQVGDIVEVVRTDPAICARILKATNSAFFGLRHKVTSIDRAVPLIGTTVVTSLALSFSLVEEAMNSGPLAEHYHAYWRQSVVQASAAEILYRGRPGKESNEYFLAGLLIDIGRLAMLKTVPDEYLPVLVRTSAGNPDAEGRPATQSLCELEAEMLDVDHVEIGARLMSDWNLPEPLQKAVRVHHLPPDRLADEHQDPDFELMTAAAIASSVGELFCSANKGPELQRLLQLTGRFEGFSAEMLDDFLDQVRARIKEAGELLSTNTELIAGPAELMAQANEHLSQIALNERLAGTQAAQRQQRVEREIRELKQQNQQLQQDPLRDPLTTLYNRQFFDESLRNELVRGSRVAASVGVIVCDLDHFERINDRHGREAGDRVLRQVASVLSGVLRGSDVAARYGGDEFIVLLPGPTEKGLKKVAERIRAQIEAQEFPGEEGSVTATVSIGAVLTVPPRMPSDLHQNMLGAAEEALDASKRNGRNQVHFSSMLDEQEGWLNRTIPQRRFSRWLVSRRVLDIPTVSKALLAPAATNRKIGALAGAQGLLDVDQIEQILLDQKETGERFGAIAVRIGRLTLEQLASLLAVQQEDPRAMGQTLVRLEILEQELVDSELRQYMEAIVPCRLAHAAVTATSG